MDNHKPGYIKIATIRGTPVLLHWSFLVGCIFIALLFRAEAQEILYICTAYATLIILHELGHAVAARSFGMQVYSIELSGIGGICRAEIPKSRAAALTYVSAGLIVQLCLLVVAGTYISHNGWPTTTAGGSIAFALTGINALMILWNLIPMKERRQNHGTDGYLLWKLLLQSLQRLPYGYPDTSATFHPNTSLLSEQGFIPAGFEVGIELLNDNSTTMEFVVNALVRHLKLPHDKAVETMLAIHNKGGLLIPTKTYALAVEISSAINDEARQEGVNLICRPVDVNRTD